ncbi:hypothetical protein ACFL3V_04390 [Nanoarchaeota archaeon]
MTKVIYEGIVPSNKNTFFTDYSALSDIVKKELAGQEIHKIWHPGGSGESTVYHIHSRHATLVHERDTFYRDDLPRDENTQTRAKVIVDGSGAAVREISKLIMKAAEAYEVKKHDG